MAGALLDTNAICDLMRDHPLLKARVTAYAGRLCTSVLVTRDAQFRHVSGLIVEDWTV